MASYPGASSNTNQPPLYATNPAAVPYTATSPPMPMPSAPGDEKPPVDVNGNPTMMGMPPNSHGYDGQKAENNAYYNGGDWNAKNNIVAPPPQHQQLPPPAASDPYNIPPSGPNGQYTVEDYQRMAQARQPRYPIEQYGRCPKDAGEHYIREEVSNSSLCLIFLIGWICPVCVTKQHKCRKYGQVF